MSARLAIVSIAMLDVTTTITVNGNEGDRFLASLARYHAPVPRALRWLATGDYRSIEVDRHDADEVASFVEGLLGSGWIETGAPPLLFSPRVGDRVLVCGEVLAEVGRHSPGSPPSWRYLPAGTSGRLLGWRGEGRAIVEIHAERRLVVFMGLRWLTRR